MDQQRWIWGVLGLAIGIVLTLLLVNFPVGEALRIAHGEAWTVLLLFAVSGLLGGLLAGLHLTDAEKLRGSSAGDHWRWAHARNYLARLALSASGGIGGGIAALFIMLLDGKIEVPMDDLLVLRYVSTSVIAGFLGYQLLGGIARQWAQQFGAMKDVADKAAQEKFEEAQRRLERQQAITSGLFAQSETARQEDVERAIAQLREQLSRYPDDRALAMILSVIYFRKRNDLEEAIRILEDAMKVMKERGTETPENIADMHYNLACYHCALMTSSTDAARRDRHRKETYRHLREAVRQPANADFAASDPDLDAIRNDPEFLQITGAAPTPSTPPAPPPPPPSAPATASSSSSSSSGGGGTGSSSRSKRSSSPRSSSQDEGEAEDKGRS